MLLLLLLLAGPGLWRLSSGPGKVSWLQLLLVLLGLLRPFGLALCLAGFLHLCKSVCPFTAWLVLLPKACAGREGTLGSLGSSEEL